MEKLIHFFISTDLVTQQGAVEIAGHFTKRSFTKNDFYSEAGPVGRRVFIPGKRVYPLFCF
jgi:hypothetical protein